MSSVTLKLDESGKCDLLDIDGQFPKAVLVDKFGEIGVSFDVLLVNGMLSKK